MYTAHISKSYEQRGSEVKLLCGMRSYEELGAFFGLRPKNWAIRSNSSKIAMRQFSAGFPLLSLARRGILLRKIPRWTNGPGRFAARGEGGFSREISVRSLTPRVLGPGCARDWRGQRILRRKIRPVLGGCPQDRSDSAAPQSPVFAQRVFAEQNRAGQKCAQISVLIVYLPDY
jgi:hypothetical protein